MIYNVGNLTSYNVYLYKDLFRLQRKKTITGATCKLRIHIDIKSELLGK